MSTYNKLCRGGLLHVMNHPELLHEALTEQDQKRREERQAYLRSLSKEGLNHEESQLLLRQGRSDEALAWCKPELGALLLKSFSNTRERQTIMDKAILSVAINGNEGAALFLLEAGANVHIRSEYGCTPLHWAGYSGASAVAKVLLDHGADVHAICDWWGKTPLAQAARLGRPGVAQVLLEHGANPRTDDSISRALKTIYAADWEWATEEERDEGHGAKIVLDMIYKRFPDLRNK